MIATLLLPTLLALPVQETAFRSDIDHDEEVLLFPVTAAPAPDGGWRMTLHAWVFEPERDTLVRGRLLAGLADSLDLPAGSTEDALFRERAAAFLVDNEGGQRVDVRIGSTLLALPETDDDGHARFTLTLPAEAGSPGSWLDVPVLLSSGDARAFHGRVRLVPAEGLTVVSDIDDTVKVTEVRDREAMLRRSFLQPFEAVPGMAAAYARWSEAGASFEYVSCSPWQLAPPLLAFLRDAGLPEGGLHLRGFRLTDGQVLSIFADPAEHKRPALQGLLAMHPARRMLLVGDSGESDPEIYGDFARAHPDAVAGILVRDVSGEDASAPRWAEAFRDLPRELWQVFGDPAEIDVERYAALAGAGP